MTAEELARSVQTTQGTISRLEVGKQTVSIDWLYKIAVILGVRASDLLDVDDSLTYAFVRGDIRAQMRSALLFPPDRIYSIPVPLFSPDLQGKLLSAFETGKQSWIVTHEEPNASVYEVGRTVVVHSSVWVSDAPPDAPQAYREVEKLSIRTTEKGARGVGYTTATGPADERWLHFADPGVKEVWLAVGEWKKL